MPRPDAANQEARLAFLERETAALRSELTRLKAREARMGRDPLRLALVRAKRDQGDQVQCEIMQTGAGTQGVVPVPGLDPIQVWKEAADLNWAVRIAGRAVWSFLNFFGIHFFEASADWSGSRDGAAVITAWELTWNNGALSASTADYLVIRDFMNFDGKRGARGVYLKLWNENWHLMSSCPTQGT